MADIRKQLDKEGVVALLEQYGKQVVISKQPNGMEYELTVVPLPRLSKREAVKQWELRRTSVAGDPAPSINAIFVYRGKKAGELDDIMNGDEVIAEKIIVRRKRKPSTTTRSNPNSKNAA